MVIDVGALILRIRLLPECRSYISSVLAANSCHEEAIIPRPGLRNPFLLPFFFFITFYSFYK